MNDKNETLDRSEKIASFWDDAGIDPIEISLPRGGGLTLRHYRTVTVETEREESPDEKAITEEEDTDGEDADATKEVQEEEDVVFLGHEGEIYLFDDSQALIDFLRSDAPHDLRDVEDFNAFVAKLTPNLLVPAAEDRYDLDLVVENLRGGHDAWEPELLVGAAELARDVAHACQLEEINNALAPGFQLDTLDDALRKGGFWARRRLKGINPETAALAWRSIIGKISGVVRQR